MTLILLRHGESIWNAEGRVQGQAVEAPGLNAAGWRQAGRATEHLERLLADQPVRLIASDLVRAVQTANVLAARLGGPLTLDPRFRELDYGALTGRQRTERWESGLVGDRADAVWTDLAIPAPGGESGADLTARAHTALIDHAATGGPEDNVVVVAHGGVLKAISRLVSQADGDPDPAPIRVRNTDLMYVPESLLQPALTA